MKARMKAGAPPHGRERGNLSVEGQMRGRNASLRVGKGVRREAYRIGLWERPTGGKGSPPPDGRVPELRLGLNRLQGPSRRG